MGTSATQTGRGHRLFADFARLTADLPEQILEIDTDGCSGGQPSATAANTATTEPITLSKPASRCPSCGHAIRWYENVPVISWLLLRGKCSACKTPISLRYPLVEAVTAGLFVVCGQQFGAQPTTLLWCGFVAVLLAASLIDWDTTLLPDDLTLPLMWAGLVVAALGWTAEDIIVASPTQGTDWLHVGGSASSL